MGTLQLQTIGVSGLILLLVIVEILRVQKFITPFTLVALPFLVIFLTTNFVLVHFKYPSIPPTVLFFLTAQMVILWVIGVMLAYFFPRDIFQRTIQTELVEQFYARFTPFFIALGLLSAAIIVKKALSLFAAHGGIQYFAHPNYEKFMTRGVAAHFIQVAKVSFFFLVISYRKSRYKLVIWIMFIILGLAIALVQVKYHVLHLVFMALLYFTLSKSTTQQLKTLVVAALLLIIFFNVFWILIALAGGVLNSQIIQKALVRYMVNYIASGTMSLETWMHHSNVMPEWAPLVTLKNMWNAFVGNPHRYNLVRVVSLDFMWIAPGVVSNVGTAYGPFFLIGGTPLAWAYTIVIGILFYLLYYLNFIFKNVFVIFLNLLFMVFAIFTFFVQYFLSPSTIEMPVILLFLAGGLRAWSGFKTYVFKQKDS